VPQEPTQGRDSVGQKQSTDCRRTASPESFSESGVEFGGEIDDTPTARRVRRRWPIHPGSGAVTHQLNEVARVSFEFTEAPELRP